MSSPGHRRLTEIFLAAADLPEQERSAFLDRACGDDSALRARVEAMLRGESDLPEVLEPGALGRLAEEDPQRIGPYAVGEKLGEGGMGVVYLAEQQEPVRRRVALKLIKLGLETKQVLARFETERQALALMNHPNIAQVYDAGATDQGRPFFAMEYVDGEPITEYCDRNGLDLPARLELFLQVCRGVQHAHQRGIIHRDIKTSNVLVAEVGDRPVDLSPVPKIIDFGISKATEQAATTDPALTQAGQMFGTPAYMSPEQAAGDPADIDTRTDVYGLGALLYELLVGRPPFEAENLPPDELRRRLREQEPTIPSAAAVTRDAPSRRRLRGDLDWITMKALARERDQRYATPSELARDVRRYLEDEPVEAGPPSRIYRARKFVMKHRAGVAFATVIVVLLVLFGVVVAHEARQADLAARSAMEQARRAHEELRHSESVNAFLVQLFSAAAPQESEAGCTTVCDLVDGVIGDMQNVEELPFVQARLNLVLSKIIRDDPGIAQSREEMRRALANMADDRETLDFLEVAGWTTAILGRLDEAELAFERLLEVRRRKLGPEDPETLWTRAELGRLHTMQGRLEQADREITEVLTAMRRVLGDDHELTLETTGYLSMVYWRQGRLDEVGQVLRPAVDTMRRVLGERHYITIATYYNLARAEAHAGDRDRAIELLRLAVDMGFIYTGRDTDGQLIHGQAGMRADPFLEPLRDHPEFDAIVNRAL